MKHKDILTISSLVSIFFLICHLTQDIMRDEGGMASYVYVTVPVLGLLLYGTLLLSGRWRYAITLFGSLVAMLMPVIHTMGAGSLKAKTHGEFFVWSLLALGVIGAFSFVLSVRGLLNPQWGEAR